jgi:hypothetical protein
LETVKELIKADPHLIYREDRLGNSPLHVAAGEGKIAVIEFLLQSGWGTEGPCNYVFGPYAVNLSARNMRGKTAAEVAENLGITKVAQLIHAEESRRSAWYEEDHQRAMRVQRQVMDQVSRQIAELNLTESRSRAILVTCPKCKFVQLPGTRKPGVRHWNCISCGKNLGYDYDMGM